VTPVRQQPTEDTVKVEYHVFDVVDFRKSFIQRTNDVWQLQGNWDSPALANQVATRYVQTQQEANLLYAHFVSLGYEGMMYRLGDCPYTVPKQEWSREHCRTLDGANPRARFLSDKDNRCWHLLKRKDWQDDEFDFVSLNTTVGEKGERGFQLWCRTKSGKEFKVSSGLTNSELDHYLSNPPTNKQIKLKYLVLSNEGIPLNATILAIL
jgi:ATP-dependent DNA ligase